MDDENTTEVNDALKKTIEEINGVESAKYVSKDEAFVTLQERWGDNAYLLDNMQSNPLPNSYMVYVSDSDAAERVATTLKKTDGVNDIVYYQDTINKLARITRFIELDSIVVMISYIIRIQLISLRELLVLSKLVLSL